MIVSVLFFISNSALVILRLNSMTVSDILYFFPTLCTLYEMFHPKKGKCYIIKIWVSREMKVKPPAEEEKSLALL